ncbi:MAG: hypothetical protein AB1568_06665 [Thermodesulfobacteriota bacterium]
MQFGRIVLALALLLLRPMSMPESPAGVDHSLSLRDAIVAQQDFASSGSGDFSATLRAIVVSMQMAAGLDRIVIPLRGNDAGQEGAIVLQADHSLLPSAFALSSPALNGVAAPPASPIPLCGRFPTPESPPPRFLLTV